MGIPFSIGHRHPQTHHRAALRRALGGQQGVKRGPERVDVALDAHAIALAAGLLAANVGLGRILALLGSEWGSALPFWMQLAGGFFALALFSSVALMFWYVIRIIMRMRSD